MVPGEEAKGSWNGTKKVQDSVEELLGKWKIEKLPPIPLKMNGTRKVIKVPLQSDPLQ